LFRVYNENTRYVRLHNRGLEIDFVRHKPEIVDWHRPCVSKTAENSVPLPIVVAHFLSFPFLKGKVGTVSQEGYFIVISAKNLSVFLH
jgi:hypothetical protein